MMLDQKKGGIYLGHTNNRKGGWKFLRLKNTGVVTQHNFT